MLATMAGDNNYHIKNTFDEVYFTMQPPAISCSINNIHLKLC